MPATDLSTLQSHWQSHWPAALRCWSPYIQLSEPTYSFSPEQDKQLGITISFAMIRLVEHKVLISLPQIAAQKLDDFALEILAHEIGHHVYCPADLTDNARVLARLRAGLPTKEHLAPFIGNLYEDLLINDRLQRSSGLRIADVYRRINGKTTDRLWLMYMRTYELLWQLERNTLALGELDDRINTDAMLASRLIRNFSKDWLGGAGRYACLCLPYLIKDEAKSAQQRQQAWNDTQDAGAGGIPDGLAEIDFDDSEILHPSEDPEISGVPATPRKKPPGLKEPVAAAGAGTAGSSGRKSMKRFRDPFQYSQILEAAGCKISQDLVTARYYRERAMPHLIRFPVRQLPNATDPTPEALEQWDIGSPLENIDWLGTVLANPTVIPGLTTRERIHADAPGNTPQTLPVDLYLGVDCSGSMGNPATQLSYPVLAGAIMALSALRAGARVMVALSGEPGKTITTPGFVRDENLVLKTLTDYLGTGTTFGIHRLAETYTPPKFGARTSHILIITDNDIFSLLNQKPEDKTGWDIARESATYARGGATYVLQLPRYLMANADAKSVIPPGEQRMMDDGWTVAHVDSEEEMLKFAKRFANAKYNQSASPVSRQS